VKGMDEEVTIFRVRFTLASGTLFRKRFLGSARLQRAADAETSTTQACAPQKALALGAKHD
jgi:hypothetical protein